MEAIRIRSGKLITPSYTEFLAQYGKSSYEDSFYITDRECISKDFFNLSIEDRLDIFEIYLEYFFRAIYASNMKNDGKLGMPHVEEKHPVYFEVSSTIESSSYNFVVYCDRTYFGRILSIHIAITDNPNNSSIKADIGFTKSEIQIGHLQDEINNRIKLVCKSICTLNPELATWYFMQGINLIEDAEANLGGSKDDH